MLRPLGIDNTVIVDVFLHKKTQAQIDLQKQAHVDLQSQLEQSTADLTTRPLLNDSPVLYIETSEQTPPTFLEQMEHTKVENTKIQKLLLHMMMLIIHKQHILLQKSDTKS